MDDSNIRTDIIPDDDENRKGGPEMECSIYQNYTADEVFVQGLAGIVNQQDVESMIRAQKKMLQRFEKTNEMLSNCNSLSASRLERANKDFTRHVLHLKDVKKDLEVVFRKIRSIKTKVAKNHSESFIAIGGSFEPVKEEGKSLFYTCTNYHCIIVPY